MGTSFNIENEKNHPEKRVFVKTGKVAIKDNGKVITILMPNETFVYNEVTKVYAVNKQAETDLSQWIEGKLVFAGAD